MSIRSHYEHDLAELQRLLVVMGENVERAIAGATWALMQRDCATARRVIREEAAIDDLRFDLEEQSLRLIARQQPLAGDLRAISALMGLASELERIGDYAEGIAKIVLRSENVPSLDPPPKLEVMAQAARNMFQDALRAVVERDATAAERLERTDDQVDALYQQVFQEIMATMQARPDRNEAATYLLWAAHNIERIADRTVNIAERATFIATGVLAPRRS